MTLPLDSQGLPLPLLCPKLVWRERGEGGEPEQEAVTRVKVKEKEGEAEGEGANIQEPMEEQSREGKSREVEGVQVPA